MTAVARKATPYIYANADYGVRGDGTTNDTTRLQAALDDCPTGGKVIFTGTPKITSALTISDHVSLEGAGVAELYNGVVSARGNGPRSSPYLSGSVLIPSTAGQNCIEVAGGINFHAKDFGIRFADAIAFTNTGHGIYCVGSTLGGGGHDDGVMSPRWEAISVFGHDGNHYAYYLLNSNLGTFTHLKSHGGGGLYYESDSHYSLYGNATFIHPYFELYAGGSAHGFHLKGRNPAAPDNLYGPLNLINFYRPQCNILAPPSEFSGFSITNPSNAQYLWLTEGTVTYTQVDDPDLEGYTYTNPITFGSGVYVRTNGISSSVIPRHSKRNIGTPTFSAGSAAGTSPTFTALESSTGAGVSDARFTLIIDAGTTPGAGGSAKICTVTVASFGTIGAVNVTPREYARCAAAGFFVRNVGTNNFEIWSNSTLSASTQYQLLVEVVE